MQIRFSYLVGFFADCGDGQSEHVGRGEAQPIGGGAGIVWLAPALLLKGTKMANKEVIHTHLENGTTRELIALLEGCEPVEVAA